MLYALLDLLVPPRCPICSGPLDTDAAGLCDRCAALMLPVRLPTEPPLAAREAAAWFQGPLRHAIHGLKFQNEPWRGRALGFAAATLAPPAAAFDLIVPVPLSRERWHPRRRRRRAPSDPKNPRNGSAATKVEVRRERCRKRVFKSEFGKW